MFLCFRNSVLTILSLFTLAHKHYNKFGDTAIIKIILELLVTAIYRRGKKKIRHADWKGRNTTPFIADNVIFYVENAKESKTKKQNKTHRTNKCIQQHCRLYDQHTNIQWISIYY